MKSYNDYLSAISKRTEQLTNDNLQLRSELLRLENAYKAAGRAGSNEAKKIKSEMDKLRGAIKENNLEIAKLKFDSLKISRFNNEMRNAGSTIKLTRHEAANLGFQLNDIFTQLASGQGIIRTLVQQGPQITQIFGGVRNTLKFLGQQAGIAFRQLITLRGGVTLLAGSIVALVAIGLASFLRRAAEESQFFTKQLGGLKGAFDVVVERASSFVEFLVRFNAKDYAGASNALRIATDKLGSALKDGYNNGATYAETIANIDKAQKNAELTASKYQKSLVQLNDIASNDTKTFGERLKALQQTAKIEGNIANDALNFARQRKEAADLVAGSNTASAKARETARQAEIEYQKAQAESESVRLRNEAAVRSLQQQRQQELESEQKKIEGLVTAYKDLVSELESSRVRANIDSLTGVDRLAAEFDFAITQISANRDKIVEAARIAGVNLPSDFEDDIKELVDLQLKAYKEAVDKAIGRDKDRETGLISNQLNEDFDSAAKIITVEAIKTFEPLEIIFRSLGKDVIREFRSGAEDEAQETLSLFERVREKIIEALKITPEQFDFITSQLASIYQPVTDIIISSTEAQIAAQDVVIERIRETTQVLQEQLNEQQKLKQDGYRNDVSELEKRLQKENAKLAKAQAERLALEKKAANQQLIADAALQASQTALAATKLVGHEAGKGIFGVLLAASIGLPLIFSIIARAKANAARFATEVPKLREGTEYLEGKSHEHGGIHIEAERGERYFSARMNEEIGGRAVSNEEVLKMYKLGVLTQKKARELTGSVINLTFNSEGLNEQRERVKTLKEENQVVEFKKAISEAYKETSKEMTAEIIAYLKSRPIEYYDSQGNKVIEREKGGVLRIDRVKKQNP